MVRQALIVAAMVGLYGCSADMSVDNPNNQSSNRATVTTETRTSDTNRNGTASVGGTWHDNSSSYQAKDPNAPVWTDPPSHPERMARSSDADLGASASASGTSSGTSSSTSVNTTTSGRDASASVAADNSAGRQTSYSSNTSSTDTDRATARTDTTTTTNDNSSKKASGWSGSAGVISPKGGTEVGSTAMNEDGTPDKTHAAAFDPNRSNTNPNANAAVASDTRSGQVGANAQLDMNKDASGAPLPGARASGDVNTNSSNTTNSDSAVTAGARTDTSVKTSANTAGDAANKLKDPDDKFVKEGASSDMFEIKSSELALKVANNDADKQFAQQMIDDHKKVSDQVKSLSQSKGFTVPGEMNSINKTMLDKLTAKSNNANKDDFTREFRDLQVQAHEAAVKLYQREADHGDDADLKKLAADTLPTLQHHLDMAKANYEQIRKDNSSNK